MVYFHGWVDVGGGEEGEGGGAQAQGGGRPAGRSFP